MQSALVWLTPTLAALLLYGLAQGLVKKYIADVPAGRYCLYFFCAKTMLYLGYWIWSYQADPVAANPFPPGSRELVLKGVLAYVLEGIGWICYYESIVAGPVTIVGTLSAAYAAPTVIFAYLILGEMLAPHQYIAVALVIGGCAGVSYAPSDPDAKVSGRRWIPLAITALIVWGLWNTTVKYCYDHLGGTDARMAVYNVIGAAMTLGIYGAVFGRAKDASDAGEWKLAVVPMLMMAGGDLGVIIANAQPGAQVSLVTAISSAYPVVTLIFAAVLLKETISRLQWACVVLILCGMFLSQLPRGDTIVAPGPPAKITVQTPAPPPPPR